MDSGPVELPTIRELLRQELQQDEKARKDALHALIERVTAYPDRKMEVKFRIGQREEEIAGGELDAPTTVFRIRHIKSRKRSKGTD